MILSDRIKNISPYPFAELNKKKRELRAKGVDLIDISIGDPDLPTPQPIVEKMKEAISKPSNHRYPAYEGSPEFKEAIAKWYQKRFGVLLDPDTEVIAVIGSKEGIANLHYAFVDPGDIVLVPNPSYPVYTTATKFAGGLPYSMPLHKSHGFLPDLGLIPENIWQKAKLLHLNYPNNPTAAIATQSFFEKVIPLAKNHNVVICHDAAYTELYYDNQKPLSFLQMAKAKEVGIEFHSLSKTFNMTGWRIGCAVGHRDAIAGLSKIKTNIDSGQFTAIQETAIYALDNEEVLTPPIRRTYQERRDTLVEALRKIGFHVEAPKATFYLWVEVPKGQTSAQFASKILDLGIVGTPGTFFGSAGEGYIRFALTTSKERLEEAVERLKKGL